MIFLPAGLLPGEEAVFGGSVIGVVEIAVRREYYDVVWPHSHKDRAAHHDNHEDRVEELSANDHGVSMQERNDAGFSGDEADGGQR